MASPDLPRLTIDLLEFPGVGLIIHTTSGVNYTNQTGGYACHHPIMEGVFAPLDYELASPAESLEHFFTGKKWNGWCMNGIDEETADFLDDLFKDFLGTKGIMVDRTKLEESEEAWIHVTISPQGEQSEIWSGLSRAPGVLTWQNSD